VPRHSSCHHHNLFLSRNFAVSLDLQSPTVHGKLVSNTAALRSDRVRRRKADKSKPRIGFEDRISPKGIWEPISYQAYCRGCEGRLGAVPKIPDTLLSAQPGRRSRVLIRIFPRRHLLPDVRLICLPEAKSDAKKEGT